MEMNKADIRVLLVDDTDYDRDAFSIFLEVLGYTQIRTAVDGTDALIAAKEQHPHLVLMDTQMHGLNGYDVCRQMRQEDYGRGAVIAGMSNSDDPNYEGLWLRNGADFYFKKFFVWI